LTSDSGYFWFFDPSNVELIVKVLDGCGVNGHFWVLAGGLTEVEVVVNVTDTVTGSTKTYTNPQGNPFSLISDELTFGGCSATASASRGNVEGQPRFAPAAHSNTNQKSAGAGSPSGCISNDTVLCTLGRYQIQASWQTPSGESGLAHAVPLTDEAGYFWFFDSSNVELVVKTVDLCYLADGHVLFAAGVTNIGVQISVIDTLGQFAGQPVLFTNPVGTAFVPIQFSPLFDCGQPTPTPTPPIPQTSSLHGWVTGPLVLDNVWYGQQGLSPDSQASVAVSQNQQNHTTTTNAGGYYEIDGLPPGPVTYQIQIPTASTSGTLTLAPGVNVFCPAFLPPPTSPTPTPTPTPGPFDY
jgi:hypothetical protein